jgi:tetratricopeptide (TPR) repeat protein
VVNTQYAIRDTQYKKSKGRVIFEFILLAVCLCIIALRTTFTESPNTQSASQPINLSGSVYSLSISAVLIFSLLSWFVWSLCSKKFYYRFTAIEIGLCLLILAAVAAGFTAANKRAAITDAACLIAPPLCAVLLVQILDSQSKIKLLLAVIAALGVVSAYQCADQFFVSNQVMIDQYEQAPRTILEPLGIQAGTFAHWLFEHRLYSRGVRGFFTTRNSAGSFALLASFAAIALFIEKYKSRKSDPSGPRQLIAPGFAVAAVLFGLVITRSKGAIAASLLAAAMFIALLRFGSRLKAHKKAILVVCLLFFIAAGSVVVLYGLTHDRLPGGNSMLVRWQYWHASARMYADHPLTGIGPGNFAHLYPRYKPAEAPETVADPHNFLLSILTQYGPLGLVGFLAMIFVPLWRAISPDTTNYLPKDYHSETGFKRSATACIVVISAALLLIRPIIMPVTPANTLGVMIYVLFILYVIPVVVFVIAFWLLTPACNTQYAIRDTNITAAALFCAALGLLFHNLIDFAIFEPGVSTTFWAIIASLIAIGLNQGSRPRFVLKPALFVRVLMAAVALVITWAYFNYCLIPVAKSTAKIQRAHQAGLHNQFQQAHNLFTAAARDDYLSSTASSLNARLYLQQFHIFESKQTDLLLQAENCLLNAIERNSADFKNFERLTTVYTLLAETSPQRQKIDWLYKALDSANRASELYPGCGRLRFELAKIAQQLGRTDTAIEQYKAAVDIEDSFRAQFRKMYPKRQIFSRLGEEKYQLAKQKIKHLSGQPTT